MLTRSSKTPVAQKSPTARKRRGARIFSLVAMLFIAGIALATSIPAAALLTPEQVAMQNEQARMKYAAFVGDGQSIGGGGGAQAAAGRDGVSLGASTSMPMVGAYSDKRLKVTVPVSSNPIKWPFPTGDHVSDTFGWRYLFGSSNFHTGLDFDLPYGTEIHSVADGIVTLVEDPGPMCGASITIEHNVGGNKFTSVYCHMITHSTPFKAGDSVKAGDVILYPPANAIKHPSLPDDQALLDANKDWLCPNFLDADGNWGDVIPPYDGNSAGVNWPGTLSP